MPREDYQKKYLKYKIKYLQLKYGGSVVPEIDKIEKIEKIKNFIKYLYTFLKNYNMCFLSGTFIFEDFNNRLYNFLTYGDDNNINKTCQQNPLSKHHWTFTHNKVFSKNGVKSNNDCFSSIVCKKNDCLKLELVFDEALNYLCDINNNNKIISNKSSKEVILYYSFEYNNKQYLFVKLENHNMNSPQHLMDFINQKRYDKYDNRRENRSGYDFIVKDTNFYTDINIKLLLNIDYKNIINEYNKNLRTGNEFFVIHELKEYLMNNYVNNGYYKK